MDDLTDLMPPVNYESTSLIVSENIVDKPKTPENTKEEELTTAEIEELDLPYVLNSKY